MIKAKISVNLDTRIGYISLHPPNRNASYCFSDNSVGQRNRAKKKISLNEARKHFSHLDLAFWCCHIAFDDWLCEAMMTAYWLHYSIVTKTYMIQLPPKM